MLRTFFLHLLLLSILLTNHALATEPVVPAKKPVVLRFCYEDKALEPYYRGDGSAVPKDHPGATIEHLRQLVEKLPIVNLELERLPWKRCLAKLKANETDALIASYRPEREALGHYPMLDGQPDPQRAFSEHQTCLVKKADSKWTWDGKQVSGIDSLVVARPLGYAPLIVPGPKQVSMHYTLSTTMDLDLLHAGRINAATTLCKIAGQAIISPAISALDLQVLQPALYTNTGYLMFSQQFYREHHAIATGLWQQLRVNKAVQVYRDYLNQPPSPGKKTQ